MPKMTFSREKAQKVIDLVRQGNYLNVAAKAAGYSVGTVHYWIQTGEGKNKERGPDEDTIWFAQEVRKAEAECETGLVEKLLAALPKEPRLIIEFLARRWPERWGKREVSTIIQGDWKSELKRMYEAGEITAEDVEAEYGPTKAQQLFEAAGISVVQQPS